MSPTTEKLPRGGGTVFHLDDQVSSGPWAVPWAGRASTDRAYISPLSHFSDRKERPTPRSFTLLLE